MLKLILGCGYLGRRVAGRWLAQGDQVAAVTRSAAHAALLTAEGIQARLADVTRPDTLRDLPAADTVLYAVGYDRDGGASRHDVQVAGLRAVLDALPSHTGRIVYVSSTAVYGDADGGWVDERAPCRPDGENGRVLLAAEELLRAHPLGSRAIVLRLAGLYGPGRIPRLHDVLAGRPLAVEAGAVVNLIHVGDAASVVLAAETKAEPPDTLVVSDGQPVVRRDFYRHLAELLRAPAPTFTDLESAGPSPRGAGRKRVRSARMLQELDVRLQYPTYHEGLAAIVREPQPPGARPSGVYACGSQRL
jgi:nucleoside-diphosphate-sugar epimerase